MRDIRRAIRYRRLGFDQALIFSKCSDRPALWAALSGAKKRIGIVTPNGKHLKRFGLINEWRHMPVEYAHSAQQHLHLAGAPDEVALRAKLEYHPPEADRAWALDWMQNSADSTAAGYLHLHAPSRWPSKYWPLANLVAFVQSARGKRSTFRCLSPQAAIRSRSISPAN